MIFMKQIPRQPFPLVFSRRQFILTGTAAMTMPVMKAFAHAANPYRYRLELKPSEASFLEDESLKTSVWSYNDTVPGPILRAKKGEEISIEVINMLEQPTSVHWHGIRLDNAMDGVSHLTQSPIKPGQSFIYRFTPPDAGTFWYHPHNRTWEQLARGLYGALVVDGDAPEDAFDQDYTIIADDWRLDDRGQLHEASFSSFRDWSHAGRLGNILTLNGKHQERLPVRSGERVRLRFINSANARIMRFAVPGQKCWLVALDGQSVPAIETGNNGVEIAPSQRFDLVIDVQGTAGDEIPIVETSGSEGLIAGYLVCGERTGKGVGGEAPRLTAASVPEPNLDQAERFDLVMSGGAMRFLVEGKFKGQTLDGRTLARNHQQFWAFNGVAGMEEKPFISVKSGRTVRLRMINETAWPHAIHLHGHHFRILKRKSMQSGVDLNLSEQEKEAFRDTVLLQRDEIVEIAFLADNPGKWMIHCHMLEHQASGMGTWFEVI